jgi:ADP-ribosyl-[dinitrogen reductase] hydrolase
MPYDANRVAGGIYGLLLGDALGVPYEFHAPSELPAREMIEFALPAGFDRAHVGWPFLSNRVKAYHHLQR